MCRWSAVFHSANLQVEIKNDMEIFAVDVGGSSIKYAVMNDSLQILTRGKAESRHLETPEQFIACLKKLYEENGSCPGGIAVSYCGELDDETGEIFSGGSYVYMAGHNLKKMLKEACSCDVSVEHDGNSAGLAELRYGCLRGYRNAVAIVIGTGLGGALILNDALYRGAHSFAGSASIMVRNLDEPFTKYSWAFRSAGAAWPGNEYGKRTGGEALDGIAFFQKVAEKDETAIEILKQYCSTLANILFTYQTVLDVEAFAIGGGISQQPVLKEYLQKAFDAIYEAPGMERLHLHKPELRICEYHNDANLIGALAHHLDQINRRV